MNTVKALLRQKKNNSGAIRRNQKLQRSRIEINLQSHVELQKRKKDVDLDSKQQSNMKTMMTTKEGLLEKTRGGGGGHHSL